MSLRSRRAPDPERTARLAARAEFQRGLDELAGKEPAPPPPARGRQQERPRVTASIVAGPTFVLEPTSYGPLRVPRPLSYAAQGRPVGIEAPTWLDIVRMMPCAICGAGAPFERQLLLGKPQSEPNHWPPKGMGGGGGSDFETHPACRECHRAITDERPTEQGVRVTHDMLDLAVAQTMRRIFLAIRAGTLQIETLTSGAVEALANRDRRR